MFRCTPFFVGAALWAFASSAPADALFFTDNFETGDLSQHDRPAWDFTGVRYGAPVISTTNPTALKSDPGPPNLTPTNFLGEFGGAQTVGQNGNVQPIPGDVVKLHLNLPQDTTSVRLKFDLYLLRTWDGSGVQYAGPDTFGYGYNDTTLLSATFSNGQGEQSYCPGAGMSPCQASFGSDLAAKNRLGFEVLLDPPPGIESQKGDPMSLLYHFSSAPISYVGGGAITFFFFSAGLQLTTDPTQPVADESWGIGGVNVTITSAAVPEPGAWTLMLLGMALLALSIRHRRLE
jgi:hypothetical protein